VLHGSMIELISVLVVLGDGGLPVVMAIVRGAFGRHAWTMQLRHQSHSRKVCWQCHVIYVISAVFCYSVLCRMCDIIHGRIIHMVNCWYH